MLKNCPICMNDCIDYYDKDKDVYVIECQHCKSNNFTIRLECKTREELEKIWNNRVMDDFILNHPDESVAYLKLLNGQKVDIDFIRKKLADFNYKELKINSEPPSSYLIDVNGNTIYCEVSHIDSLLKSLGLEILNDLPSINQTALDEIIQRVFIRNGYIKLYKQFKLISIEINCKKTNKNQIDSLIKFLTDLYHNEGITTYYLELYNDLNSNTISTYYSLNDLILYLDKLF